MDYLDELNLLIKETECKYKRTNDASYYDYLKGLRKSRALYKKYHW